MWALGMCLGKQEDVGLKEGERGRRKGGIDV